MNGTLMESEICQQPEQLAHNAAAYFDSVREGLKGHDYQMVLLAARGSSDNAALYARYLIEIHLRIPVSLAAPSVITKFGSDMRFPKCLAVGISQSGAAPDVAEVLNFMRASGHGTLAITNTPGSRLTEEAEHTILLNVDAEKSVAATKTYTASLLALYQAVRALGANLPDPAGHLPDASWLQRTRDEAEEAFGILNRQTVRFSLGRGFSFATCCESALKLMECALLPCKAYSTADFQHGPKALAGPESTAIVYGEAPSGLTDFGCVPIYAPQSDRAELAPLSDVLFGQWLALFTARSRNLDPDTPRNLSKVTLTL